MGENRSINPNQLIQSNQPNEIIQRTPPSQPVDISNSDTETNSEGLLSRNPPKFPVYQNSGHYDALDLDRLYALLQNYQRTPDQLRQDAINQYQPTYEMERLAQQHMTETTIQGLQNQAASLQFDYDKRLRQTASTYAQNLSNMLNNLTKRGMGRSSLVGTGSVSMANAQNREMQQIWDQFQVESSGIHENIALATRQGAEALAQLGTNYAQQVEARQTELMNQQQTAATQLQLQIAQLQYQGYQDWLNTPARQGGGKNPRRSSNRGSTNRNNPSNNVATPPSSPPRPSDSYI